MRENLKHVEKVLDAIEAVIENRASQDQMSYSIKGTTLSRTPIADLLLLRREYKEEYKMELLKKDTDEGKGFKMLVRNNYTRPW
jgi:hypothetical protein